MRLKPILPILLSAVCLTPVACKEKGPLEKAGDAVSDAATETEDSIQEGVDKVGEAGEEFGESVKDTVTQ